MPKDEQPPADRGDVRADVEALKQDLNALRRDMQALVQDLISAGKAEAGEAFTNAARSRLDECGVDLDLLTQRSREVLDTVQEQVERHPLMSVGIAVGVGMMLASIFRRR